MAPGPADYLPQALGLRNGESPFPWQLRLLSQMVSGHIPRALDMPTGLGKTSVMAIWLVARAHGAKLPRRLVYVVDRRAVVDQATEVATALRQLVDHETDFRAHLGLPPERSLPISTLRGQFVDNREWLEDPASPAIIVGTVDMIGSRLLFEGYGVSRKMRPFQAGMIGVDALLVLDEAHLVPPFERLIESVVSKSSGNGRDDPSLRGVAPPLRLLSLSATGRSPSVDSLALTAQDRDHPEVVRRLHASKSLRVHPLEGDEDLPEALVRAAWDLTDDGRRQCRCIIYCNRRRDAEAVKAQLDHLAQGECEIDTELFVGARRVFEREIARRRLAELGFIAGAEGVPERATFLVATSAAEVGVDLDADHMVADLVAWERMVQRLGRVNRRGRGSAQVEIIVAPPGKKADDRELEAHLARRAVVEALRPGEDGALDASPAALEELKLRAEVDGTLATNLRIAISPAPLYPGLDRPTLDAWSLTSLREHTGRPKVAPWLRGWVEDEPQTRLVWRVHLPLPRNREPLKKDVVRFFAAAPPHTSEVLETETYRVAEWLFKRIKRSGKVLDRTDEETAAGRRRRAIVFALDQRGEFEARWSFGELEQVTHQAKKVRDRLERQWRDRTLVIDAEVAGLDEDGLLDDSWGEVPRTADANEWLPGNGTTAPVPGYRIREIGGDEPAIKDPNWRERERIPFAYAANGEVDAWLAVEKWRNDAATEEDRSAGRPQRLDEHQAWAEREAGRLAERVGLPDPLASVLRLAARLHDEGKRARHWQRAFHAPGDTAYAKTRGPVDIGLLDGYRHEFGSLTVAEKDPEVQALNPEHRDLLMHLIAAHHGFGRPLIRTSGCEDGPPSALERRAREVAHRFLRLQDRYGPWGLAWLESLLRAADQRASRENDQRDREEN